MRKCIQKKQFFPYFFIALFVILTSLSVFMYGDDYLWYYSTEDPQLSSWAAPNGRFVSNQITVWLCRSISFRTIFIALFYCFMLIFLSNLFDFRNITKNSKYYLTLLLFIFIPSKTYAETVLWISGFANYIFPMVIVFAYLLFMFSCLFKDKEPPLWIAMFLLPASLVSGLCVEHITIYNVFISVVMIILIIKLKRKGVLHAFMFFSGAVISCIVMFANRAYSNIASTGDSVGNRTFKIGLSNIFENAYSFVVSHYTKDFWIIPIIITVSFSLLYVKKEFSDKKPKYLMLCLAICWLYSIYSIYTVCICNFRIFSPAKRIVALEAAFSFVYVVSLAYLISVFFDKNGMIRAYIYLVSTFLLTAPFVFISPATARCFLANELFWILLCGETVTSAFRTINVRYRKKFSPFAFIASFAGAFLILFICFSNKYVNTIRYKYIKEQLAEEKNKKIELIMLPYTEYSHEDLEEGLFSPGIGVGEFGYNKYILRYHDIDYNGEKEYVELEINPYDYFIKKAE